MTINTKLKPVILLGVQAVPLYLIANYAINMFDRSAFTDQSKIDNFVGSSSPPYVPVMTLAYAFLATMARWLAHSDCMQAPTLAGSDSTPLLLDADSTTSENTKEGRAWALGRERGRGAAVTAVFFGEVCYRMISPMLLFGAGFGVAIPLLNNATDLPDKVEPLALQFLEIMGMLPTLFALKVGLFYGLRIDRYFNQTRTGKEVLIEVAKAYLFQLPFILLDTAFQIPDPQGSMRWSVLSTLVLVAISDVLGLDAGLTRCFEGRTCTERTDERKASQTNPMVAV